MVTMAPRTTVFACCPKDSDPYLVRLVTTGGDPEAPVACLISFIKRFCGADYYKALQDSDEDDLWLEQVAIDSMVGSRDLHIGMAGSERAATIDDEYVLFGVLLCNLNSKTIFNQDWFRDRANDLVALFPEVSIPPPVPLYSESQADALAAFEKQWPHTTAHIIRIIIEGHFSGPLKRLQGYVCAQWSTAVVIETGPVSTPEHPKNIQVQEANQPEATGLLFQEQPLKDTASVVATVPQAPDAAHYEAPAAQSALQTTETKKPFLSAPQEPALPHNFVVQQPRQHYDSDPTIDGPHREVLPIATVVFVNLDLRTFKWTSMPGQAVFVFPSPQDIDPNWIRLVTRNSDPHTIIAYLLGLIERVGNADFQRIVNAAAKEGLKLEQVRLSRRDIRLDLNGLLTDSEPAPTKDDFHVLLAILLCILSGPRGIDMNRRWYQTHVKDLMEIFPEVSAEVTVPLWHKAQADAICAFGDRWPCTRAAIRSIILKRTFTGAMQRLQRYASSSWE
ncbi:uncharacterized protein LOC142803244 [Rhipicephalus microplus]|uniref:uncharacterized protein LOC142803244 n=1 Tax=Rhipicephalus microplus TaxID=6941 RepID=UPI003F6ADC4E